MFIKTRFLKAVIWCFIGQNINLYLITCIFYDQKSTLEPKKQKSLRTFYNPWVKCALCDMTWLTFCSEKFWMEMLWILTTTKPFEEWKNISKSVKLFQWSISRILRWLPQILLHQVQSWAPLFWQSRFYVLNGPTLQCHFTT